MVLAPSRLLALLLIVTCAACVPVLFIDNDMFASQHNVQLTVNKPSKGPVVIAPTEPWESWAVFG